MGGKIKAGEQREIKLNDRLADLEKQIAEKTELLNGLNSEISGIDHLPADLQSKMEAKIRTEIEAEIAERNRIAEETMPSAVTKLNGLNEQIAEKESKVVSLNAEIEDLEQNAAAHKKAYKEEAVLEVEIENEKKAEEIRAALSEAEGKKNEASTTLSDAKRIRAEADEWCKTERKKIDDEKKASMKEAEDYSKETRKKADEYVSAQEAEITAKKKDLAATEKTLSETDRSLRAKENVLADREIEINKRYEDAEFGFKKELIKEREKFDTEIADLKDEIADLGKDLIAGREKINDELKTYKETELKRIDSELQAQRDWIASEEKRLQEKEAELESAKAEIALETEVIKTKKDTYDRKTSELETVAKNRLEELYREVIAARDTFRARCNELQAEVDEKQKTIVALTAKLKSSNGVEIDSLQAEIKELKDKIVSLQDSENSVIGKLKQYNVDSASLVAQLFKIEGYDKLLSDYESLNRANEDLKIRIAQTRQNEQALELESKRANQYQTNYENAIEQLERLKKPSRKDRLSSFTPFNDFDYVANLEPYGNNLGELSWLKNIQEKMELSGIKISPKLLYAFHTSVKIHDWSPLVVLAGVSGTGKSELPRQYAHHGGMNFVSVPVKPDWDSMQSLFGYYNSIENKFEPTELSRAIYYMQSAQMKNTMLLILLDEMNLAYVELYFSDLLSKFETNRGTDDVITYDISLGANETPEKMEIGSNILWVGTMNEDETTKALSDKVVDRSTLLTFPRPKTLVSRRADVKIAAPEKRLSQNVWNKWCKVTLDEEQIKGKIDIENYRKIIESINDQMSKVNRNLGHRVWQSIERYVFSHPLTIANIDNGTEFKKQFDSAFAEAVAFKVMPKLRGIEVSGESKKVLDAIGVIINTDVPSLSEDYKQAMSLSSRIFQWCSAKFMDVESTNN